MVLWEGSVPLAPLIQKRDQDSYMHQVPPEAARVCVRLGGLSLTLTCARHHPSRRAEVHGSRLTAQGSGFTVEVDLGCCPDLAYGACRSSYAQPRWSKRNGSRPPR
eukprot:823664-Rhodomonas_salina.2